MRCVLDTCALIWCTTDLDELTQQARAIATDPGSRFIISSVSIWEIALKHRRGLLDVRPDMERYMAKLRRSTSFDLADVTADIWLANVALDWDHRDPADRTIVATAELHDLPIMTRDRRMIAYYGNVIRA